jgi:uncharacterized damage-inducible protein DinB
MAITDPVTTTGVNSDPITPLHHDNDHCLGQLERFLQSIDAANYRDTSGSESAIGAHVRHLLEHYEILIRDAGSAVDYDHRARDPEVESCPEAARLRLRSARERLRQLAAHHAGTTLPILYTPAGSAHARGQMALRSSLARELMFLHSHTVHHMALIAVLGRQRGLTLDDDFGVAPATLRHRG